MGVIKRKAAAGGISLLISIALFMLTGVNTAYAVIPAMAVVCFVLLLRKKPAAIYLLAATAAFCAGALLLFSADSLLYRPSLAFTGKNITVTGTVLDCPVSHDASESVDIGNCFFNGIETKYSVRVYYSDGAAPRPGDTVTFTVSEVFANAEEDSKYFYHSLSDKVWLSAFAQGDTDIIPCVKQSPREKILSLRFRVRRKIAESTPEENAAVISALLTGDQTEIPDEIKNNFRMSGISHIFAVSGMHLSMWSGLIFFLLTKRSRTKLLPNIGVILFVLLYCIFTGMSPSVLRAGIMLIMICAGNVLRKHADPLNSLGLSALLLLIVNPWLGGNISFLLSFTSTFAIVGFFPFLKSTGTKDETNLRRFFRLRRDEILLTLTVLFTALPLTSYFFGYLSVLSPFTSLVCTPLAQLMMLFSAVGLLFPAGTVISQGAFIVSSALSSAIVKLTGAAASLTSAIFPLREYYIILWFILSAAVFFAVIHFRCARRTILNTGLLLTCVILAAGIGSTLASSGDYTLLINDSGNATFISVLSGSGRSSLLLGCGGDYSAYSDAKDTLHGKAVFSADVLLIPRAGQPEAENLERALTDFRPKELIVPVGTEIPDYERGNVHFTDSLSRTFFDGVTAEYFSAENYCAGVMTINGTKAVFCLYPSSYLTEEKLMSGDYLLCRGMIPQGVTPENFNKIIVLSDKSAETLGLPANAVSTADTGRIEMTIRG